MVEYSALCIVLILRATDSHWFDSYTNVNKGTFLACYEVDTPFLLCASWIIFHKVFLQSDNVFENQQLDKDTLPTLIRKFNGMTIKNLASDIKQSIKTKHSSFSYI